MSYDKYYLYSSKNLQHNFVDVIIPLNTGGFTHSVFRFVENYHTNSKNTYNLYIYVYKDPKTYEKGKRVNYNKLLSNALNIYVSVCLDYNDDYNDKNCDNDCTLLLLNSLDDDDDIQISCLCFLLKIKEHIGKESILLENIDTKVQYTENKTYEVPLGF
jgi:hypothetical protein